MFVVLEIQVNQDNTIATIATPFTTQNEAESKYHDILHYAAISTLPRHSAIVLTDKAIPIMYQTYEHKTEEEI